MKKLTLVTISLFLLSVSGISQAGIVPPVVSVPIDSPWMLIGLSVLLATVGARLFKNRRK